MAKRKKSSMMGFVLPILEVAFIVLLFCTLAMTAVRATLTTSIGGSTSTRTSTTGMCDFLGSVFNGDVTNGWAITAVIFYLLSLVLGGVCAILAVLKICGIKLKFNSKFIEVLLFISSLVLLVSVYVYASQNGGTLIDIPGLSTSSNIKANASWAPWLALGASFGAVTAKCLEK